MQTERRVGRKTDTCGYNQRSKRTKQTQTGDKGQGTKDEGRRTWDGRLQREMGKAAKTLCNLCGQVKLLVAAGEK